MKTILKSSTILLTFAFLITSCGQPKESDNTENSTEQNHVNDEHNHDHEEAGTQAISKEQTASIFDAYLQLKDGLVQSSEEIAKNAAEEIHGILNAKSSESKVLKDIAEDANNIMNTNELEQIRKHFEEMSKEVYSLIKTSNTGKAVYKQYCPMAFNNTGAFWLSSEEEIKNPYFGDKMLKCGKVQETITSN